MGRFAKSAEWRFFGVLMRANRALAFAWWSLIVVRAVLPAIFALSMGALVNAVQDDNALGGPLTAVGITFVLLQALGPIHDALSTNLGAQTTAWLNDQLLHACTNPGGLAHLEQPALADRLGTAREFELGMGGPNITISMPNIGAGFASFGGGLTSVCLLFGFQWWAPLLVGGAWLSTHKFLGKTAIWRERHEPDVAEQERRANYAYRLTVDAPGAKEVRLFGLADWVVDGFVNVRRALIDRSWKARRLQWSNAWIAIIVVGGANALFFWRLAEDTIDGDVSLGAVVVFAQAAIGASTLAFGEWDWWLRTAAQPVPLVVDLIHDMRAVGALPSGSRSATNTPAHEIRFDNVSFAYPTTDKPVFDGLDLTIPAGRSLAIVGQNGAGKTTLAKLVCRMYDPDQGALRIDGIDARDFGLVEWRERVAAVCQDFVRYELTLRENVAPSGADDSDIAASLEAARAADLASLDTVLSRAYEGGTDFSGGQWQRIALARAICAVRIGAGVIILDEPTAQLDVRGEATIFESLLDATRGCTTILISHRFSTVRRADLICVLEEGKVVELGSHDELVAKRGRYATMFELQASRFEDEPDLEVLDS